MRRGPLVIAGLGGRSVLAPAQSPPTASPTTASSAAGEATAARLPLASVAVRPARSRRPAATPTSGSTSWRTSAKAIRPSSACCASAASAWPGC